MIVPYLLAVATAVRCWWTWLATGYTMEPDFSLYTQGGLGLYPSPLGRALGALGPEVFAFLSAVSAGAVVYLVALLARRQGANPWLAALLASVMPATLYLGYAGIDPIGLALLLMGLVTKGDVVYRYTRGASLRPGSPHVCLPGVRRSDQPEVGLAPAARLLFWPVSDARLSQASALVGPSLVTAAALSHLSLAPFALLLLPRSTWPARFALGTFAAVLAGCLLLTPYAPVVYGWAHPEALKAAALGLLAFGLIALPALLLGRFDRLVGWALAVGVGECLAQHHLQARYLLPAAFLMAATASLTRARVGASTAAVTEGAREVTQYGQRRAWGV